jgi:hypothetical protein
METQSILFKIISFLPSRHARNLAFTSRVFAERLQSYRGWIAPRNLVSNKLPKTLSLYVDDLRWVSEEISEDYVFHNVTVDVLTINLTENVNTFEVRHALQSIPNCRQICIVMVHSDGFTNAVDAILDMCLDKIILENVLVTFDVELVLISTVLQHLEGTFLKHRGRVIFDGGFIHRDYQFLMDMGALMYAVYGSDSRERWLSLPHARIWFNEHFTFDEMMQLVEKKGARDFWLSGEDGPTYTDTVRPNHLTCNVRVGSTRVFDLSANVWKNVETIIISINEFDENEDRDIAVTPITLVRPPMGMNLTIVGEGSDFDVDLCVNNPICGTLRVNGFCVPVKHGMVFRVRAVFV